MKIELEIIKEAIKIIEEFPEDKKVLHEQCLIIIRQAKELNLYYKLQ